MFIQMYLEGSDVVKQDYYTALSYFQKAADKGNPVGESGLGIMYLYGKGVKRDYAKAYKNFNKASSQGWVEGQLHLGIMYLKGYGVAKEYKTAIKYFTLASQAGNVLAIYHLAQMHVAGQGTLKICTSAAELFKGVSERGSWSSLLMDAHTDYKEGRVLESFFRYSFLAELGYEVAQSNAAFILDRNELQVGIFDRPGTYGRAFKYWRRSAEQGYSVARVKLGDYHYYGQGTETNLEQAADEYRIAGEEKHNAQAWFNLAYMHEQGLGLKRDLHLAKRYYDLADKSSIDAHVPVALARIKLQLLQWTEYAKELTLEDVSSFLDLESLFGKDWDLCLLTILGATVFLIFYLRRTIQ